jgi:anaerobic ribonucleoside-triphosphate reductase activating protein
MENETPTLLNVAHVADSMWSAGPGLMLTIWVQGCNRRCPGCINPDFLDLRERHLIPPERLLERLRSEHDGVCFSGGEPFLQAKALAELARFVRETDRTVVSYSGFLREELESDAVAGASELLSQLDVLIDGPFMPELAAPLPWRGSNNQRVHFLTSRHTARALENAVVNDLTLSASGSFTNVGTAGPALSRLVKGLRAAGWRPSSSSHLADGPRESPTI